MLDRPMLRMPSEARTASAPPTPGSCPNTPAKGWGMADDGLQLAGPRLDDRCLLVDKSPHCVSVEDLGVAVVARPARQQVGQFVAQCKSGLAVKLGENEHVDVARLVTVASSDRAEQADELHGLVIVSPEAESFSKPSSIWSRSSNSRRRWRRGP